MLIAKRIVTRLFKVFSGASVAFLVFSLPAFANDLNTRYNLREPVTALARDLYFMQYVVLAIWLGIFVGVFGVMFYSMYAHR